MQRRIGKRWTRVLRSAVAGVVLAGTLVVAPFPAAADPGPTPDGPATTADPLDPTPIPGDLADAITRGPTRVVVGVQSPAATAALQRAGDQLADQEQRQADVARAADAFAADKDTALAAAGAGVQQVQSFDHLPVEVVTVQTPEALSALATAPGVSSLALPRRFFPTADADLELIGQPAAQALGYTGAGVTIAVIDTGVAWDWPGVGDTFGDCSNGPGTGSCRIDRLVDVVHSGLTDTDPQGHGTNVSGVVARTAPGAHLDVYGVFPEDQGAWDTDIFTALNDIAANGVARGVRAVNMSFGDSSQHTTACTASAYSSAFQSLRALGILPVVSAGNTAYLANTFVPGVSEPACATGAIPVGATYTDNVSGSVNWGPGQCQDINPTADRITCFSQGGPLVSLLAPGVNITAAGVTESGTSQAAPHVAGAVADVVCANPHATAGEIADFLTGTGPRITDNRGTTATTVRRLDIPAAGAAAAATGLDTAGGFVSLTPARLLDTRFGPGPIAAVPSLSSIAVQVTGQCGVPVSGVSAVALNVTVTVPEAPGFITAYPSGLPVPISSNLNFMPGQTVPNLVVAPIGADGKIALYNGSPGSVQLVADIAGYWVKGRSSLAGAFSSVTPQRLLDTRIGTGANRAAIPGGGTVSVDVTRARGVPTSNVSTVVLNVTVTVPQAAGFITAFASGGARPAVSNLNFVRGQTVPNLVFAPVGADGRVTLYNNAPGTVELVADIYGYVTGGVATAPGTFQAVAPTRLLDTRYGTGAARAAISGQSSIRLGVTGVGGVPASGVSAVVLNVTVTEPTAAGFLTAHATGGRRPVSSNLNFIPGQTVPNLVVAPVGADGTATLFNGSPGTLHLVADVAGYFVQD